jgi:hypothetical protein
MKLNNFFKLLLSAFVVSVLVISCVKEGAPGLDGANGKDGKDGVAGADGTTACAVCHKSTLVTEKQAQMEIAKHLTGEAWFEGSRNSCAPCHSTNGYLDVIANNPPITAYNTKSTTPTPNPISCRACHKVHETNTAADWALTSTNEVSLVVDQVNAKKVNLEPASNLCIQCHQSRPIVSPDLSKPNDAYTSMTQYRWGGHYGTQGTIFAGKGKGSFEIAGSEPYENTKAHNGEIAVTITGGTLKASCAECHMATMSAESGGHTFLARSEGGSINYNGCAACHYTGGLGQTSTVLDSKTKALQAEVTDLIKQLGAKLDAKNYLDKDPAAEFIPGTGWNGYINRYDASTNPDGVPTANWKPTNLEAAAISNFQFVLRDKSLGIHNPTYVRALLKNTIAALK